MAKRKFFKTGLWTGLTLTSATLMAAVLIGNGYALKYPAQINSYFNTKDYEVVQDDEGETDTTYYRPKFTKDDGTPDKDKLYAYDKSVARQMANEGAVLLWNTDHALPLSDKGQTVNFFGGHSVGYYFVTDGSGGVRMAETPTLLKAFKEHGYQVNQTLWDFYAGHSYGGGSTNVNETSWSSLDGPTLASVNGGVGIYVISRKASEGSDMAMTSSSDGENGNNTALSQAEKDHLANLAQLKREGKISKFIVLLNTVSGGVQFDVLAQYKDDIDACMWVGLGGTSGPDSVADLIAGDANPSGRLSDTFVYNSFSAPATANFGDFDYSGMAGFSNDPVYKKLLAAQGSTDSTEKNLKYLVYQEGIYVGYRYYETRYEDAVLGQGNATGSAGAKNSANGWDYHSEVAFPFGFGESYADFAYSDYEATATATGYDVSVTVTNTGDVTGKDVVQFYLQKPYTDYDRQNDIEQASVNLVGFAKTADLKPGAQQRLTAKVKKDAFLTYDANKAETYITEGGDYYLAFGDNAHAALDNILAAKGYEGEANGNAALVRKITLAQDLATYKSPYTGADVVNRFDEVDINKSGYGAGEVTYLSRNNWQGTYPTRVDLRLTASLLKDLDYGKSWEDDVFDTMPEYGQQNGLNLFSVWKDSAGTELPYDHEMWDKLLDETTFREQTYLVANAWCATQSVPSVSAPGTQNRDGPAGLNYLPDGKVIGLGMCYPSENLMASSFNRDLVREIGVCLGEDNFATGFTFLYAPGANTHRSAFGGRNGEYFSEDGYLSGELDAVEVQGIQSNGSGAQIKHFALNDAEVNRNGVSVWANEQSIREIYLKAFELACAKGEGEAYSIMSSFNRVGALWSGASKALVTDVLRGEWGFIGFVQSDGNGYALMSNYVDGLRAGNDLFMCGGGDRILDDYKNSSTIAKAMREATHRVLYVLTKTHAMNGLSSSTRIHVLTPWWRTGIDALIITTITLTSLAAAVLVVCLTLDVMAYKKKKQMKDRS